MKHKATADIAEIAKKYTHYDMIQTYTKLPAFPEHRVKLLLHFIDKGSTSSHQHSELLGLVTSLVQIGLDAHDRVDNEDLQEGSKAERSRQLSILAGDYLSSRFYQLLSQAGQIEMIRRLSTAICDVNKLKMDAYAKMKKLALSAEEYMRSVVAIRIGLFLPFTNVMEGSYRLKWPELLEHLAYCEVIVEELKQDRSEEHRGWAYWYIRQNGQAASSKVRPQLIEMFEYHWEQLIDKLSPFHADKWIRDLSTLGIPFNLPINYGKLVQENLR